MILVFLSTAKQFPARTSDKLPIARFVQRRIQHLGRKPDTCTWQS